MREIEMKRSHGSVRALALFAYISVLIVSLSGCKDDKDGSSAHMGKVSLNLRADTTSLKKGIHSSVTKAVSDEFADFLTVDDYRILIVAGTDTAKQYDRFDKMPAEFDLPEGSYSLIASKGNNLPAEYENPYFEGSTDFTVKEGMSSPLDVTCSLGNTRIMAEYTDDFKEAYSEYTVLLSSANTTADFEIAKGETRPAYMQVAKDGTDIAVGIRLKKVNAQEEKTYYVPNAIKMERRQNVRLIFKTDGEALEGIGLDVMLDDSLATQSFTTKIPDFMWQQFKEPTLSPTEFKSGDTFEFKSGTFDKNPYIGINMPGRIGSLIIKYWKEGEDEEDAAIYDLATDAGVKAAEEQHYTWSVGEVSDMNISKEKAAILYLKEGLNSLLSSDTDTYYHYKIYGTDATGKAKESNVITFDVKVLPADAPIITTDVADTPYEIVEGDELSSDWIFKFTATGSIDAEATKVVVNDGGSDVEYRFISDGGESLRQSYGVKTEISNAANAIITFPKSFSAFLKGPEVGSKAYKFTFYLKDRRDNEYLIKKTINVHAPVFTLETTNNDAFAKRVVLRVNMPLGNSEKLSFQYKKASDLEVEWKSVVSSKMIVDGGTCVDTLKGLETITQYNIRAIYENNLGVHYGNVISVETERPGDIPNKGFDHWSIAPDSKGSNKPGYDKPVGIFGELEAPYRSWELWLPWDDNHNDKGWNTLNKKTTSEGTLKEGTILKLTPPYSWTRYCANSGTIPFTEGDNKVALIRTVGWGGNTSAAVQGLGAAVTYKTPGELYLGSYGDKPEYGVPFDSRPLGFSFYYKYNKLMAGDDTFTAEIVVLGEDNNLIAKAKYTSSSSIDSWKKQTVYLNYEQGAAKAKKMYIRFVSGQQKDYKPGDFVITPDFANLSNGEYTGSHLYIDNVELIYE